MLMVPVYAHVFTPKQYGAFDFLALIGSFLNLLIVLEVSQGVARYYTDATHPAEKTYYASSALWFTVAAYFLFTIIAINFIKPLTVIILDENRFYHLLAGGIIAISANGIFFHLQNQLRWEFKAKKFAITSVLYAIIAATIVIVLIKTTDYGPVVIFWGQIIGAIAGGAIAFCYTRKSFKLQFSFDHLIKMIKFSMPLVASSIAVYCSIYVDRLFIKTMLGLKSLGIYGIGYRFASVVGLIIAGFQGAITPLVYKYHSATSTPGELAVLFRYFIIMILPLNMFIGIFSREIVIVLTSLQYTEAWRIIPILSFGIILSNMYIFAPGLFIHKKTTWFAVINIIASITNAGFNYILIPHFGIIGAAVATTTTALLSFIVLILISQKLYPVPYCWDKILVTVITVVSLTTIAIFFQNGNKIEQTEVILKLIIFISGIIFITGFLLCREERTAIKIKILNAITRE